MKNKYHAFLSHNSQDKLIVEQIAQWLEDNAKLSVWLDKCNIFLSGTFFAGSSKIF